MEKKLNLLGKIDRLDIAESKESGKFIRIIDYKSSNKVLSLSNVYYGLQLQLLTYLDAASKKDNLQKGGVLYFDLSKKITQVNPNISPEEIEDEIRKQFQMNGLILADVKLFKLMDKNMDENNKSSSEFLPIKINTDGSIAKSNNVATYEQFENLSKYINKTLKKILNEMTSGNISINPYWKAKKTPCEYCKYRTICNFDLNLPGSKYRYLSNLSADEVYGKI